MSTHSFDFRTRGPASWVGVSNIVKAGVLCAALVLAGVFLLPGTASAQVTGTIFSTINGDPADGGTVTQGETVTVSTGVDPLDNSEGLELRLVADGSTPNDAGQVGGEIVCEALFEAADCTTLMDALAVSTTNASGPYTPVDNISVTIKEDAPVGDWNFGYFLVDAPYEEGVSGVHGTATFNFSVEAPPAATIDGEPYDSIQDAIDNAEPGDTIEVAEGVHDELIRTSVEGITVTAPNGATIQPSQSTIDNAGRKRVVDLGGDNHSYDNVTFSGFTIIGPGKDSGWVGITVTGDDNEASGNTVKQVLTGIQTTDGNATGATIEGNTIEEAQVGISVQSQNTEVTNNTISNVSFEGMGIGSAKGNDTSDVVIENNTFDTTSDNINFYHGTNGGVDVGAIIINNDFARLITVASEVVGGANAGEVSKTLYASLADAVDAADESGDTLTVSEGTYELSEQLDLNNPITISGEGTAVVKAKDDVTWSTTNGEKHLMAIFGGTEEDPITVSGITLAAAGTFGLNTYGEAYGILENVTIENGKGAAITVNGSTIVATDLSTSGNAWGGVNVDPGSGVETPSSFTLSSGTIEEGLQIWSDGTNVDESATVTVDAAGYTEYEIANTTMIRWANRALTDVAIIASSPTVLYTSIQAAINAAIAGDTVEVRPGTYEEAVEIAKNNLTLQGAGAGTIVSVVGGGTGITVSADDVTLSSLQVEKGDASDSDDGKGIEAVGASVSSLVLNDVNIAGATNGFRVGSGTTVDGLTVVSSHFDGNEIGWYLAKETSASAAATVTNVNVSDSSFNNNSRKGLYAEKLDNALFDNIEVLNSGTSATYGFNNGIDINLKFGDYENITLTNFTISGSGMMGGATAFDPAGLAIKARDDGATYGANPARLTGVTLTNVNVSGGVVGIRFGEEGKGNAGPTGVEVASSSLSGTGGFGLINETQALVTATDNYWGAASGPSGEGAGAGDAVSENVTFRPWLLEEGGEQFDETIALTEAGEWTLVSASQLLSEAPAVVDDEGGVVTLLGFEDGEFTTPTDNEKPISAFYAQTTNKGGVGFSHANPSEPTQTSKELAAGWNLVGTNNSGTVQDEFSSIQNTEQTAGMVTLHVQDTFNVRKDFGSDPWTSDANKDLNANPLTELPAKNLSAYDGYWVFLNAAKTFSKLIGSTE